MLPTRNIITPCKKFLKIWQIRNITREGTIETVVAYIERLQSFYRIELRRNGTLWEAVVRYVQLIG